MVKIAIKFSPCIVNINQFKKYTLLISFSLFYTVRKAYIMSKPNSTNINPQWRSVMKPMRKQYGNSDSHFFLYPTLNIKRTVDFYINNSSGIGCKFSPDGFRWSPLIHHTNNKIVCTSSDSYTVQQKWGKSMWRFSHYADHPLRAHKIIRYFFHDSIEHSEVAKDQKKKKK